MVRNLGRPSDARELIDRVWRLRENTPPVWGRMTAGQMVCHLTDAFRLVYGEKHVNGKETWLSRTLIRWVAIHTNVAWRKNFPTTPEMDQNRGGTRPRAFAQDRDELVTSIERFASLPAAYGFPRHPYFGAMTHQEWMIWAYRHIDHHLRQFGV